MIYSCFDQNSGIYHYYSDSKSHPLNLDLPVPKLPNVVNGVGSPAILSARPLPSGASKIGSGWQARGVLVDCNLKASGLGNDVTCDCGMTNVWKFLTVASILSTAAFLYYRFYR